MVSQWPHRRDLLRSLNFTLEARKTQQNVINKKVHVRPAHRNTPLMALGKT